MPYFDTYHRPEEDEGFGDIAFDMRFPHAVRSLEDTELQVLLVALLREWRSRVQMR